MSDLAETVAWLRRWILADREAAERAQQAAPGTWWHNHDDAPGVIYTIDGPDLIEVPEELRPVTEHLVRHDPRNVIARCDAELAILDPDNWGGGPEAEDAYRQAVRMLAQGYRHRDNRREEGTA